MDKRCPFCLDGNVAPVGRPLKRPGERHCRQLMECRDCERWYWEGTGREVPRLFEICATAVVSPWSCCEEVREALGSGGTGGLRRRASELNWLCSACPYARFMAWGPGDDPGAFPVALG